MAAQTHGIYLTDEEKAQIEAMGGWEKLMEAFKKRLEEQEGATMAATSGSAPVAPRPSAPTATTPRASASARKARAIAARSRSGTSGNTAISTIRWCSAPAISRWRSGAFALRPRGLAGRIGSRRHHQVDRRKRRLYPTSRCGPSAGTPSRCCYCSMSAARWTTTSAPWRSCSRPRGRSSSIWNITTSTTASTSGSGRITVAATPR